MIQVSRNEGVELVRLAHGKASALDIELAEAIASTFGELARSDARAVVLTGSGSIFSAGVDLFRILEEGTPYVERFLPRLDAALRAVFELPKPLVCAINGHAIAGGCLLAASGDVRLMAEGKARIGVPELAVGVPFPPYALEMMRLTVAGRSLERLVYSAETLLPDAALDAGLIDRVVPPEELESRALEEAARLGSIRPEAFAVTKSQIRGLAARRVDALGDEADRRTMELWTSETTHQCIREYLDRTVRK